MRSRTLAQSRPFSELLLDAAGNIENLSRFDLQILLRRAALRLRAAEMKGLENLEHVPVYSYHLLRRLGEGPVDLASLYGTEDEGAVEFLVSRGLAERNEKVLTITPAGRVIGEVEDERGMGEAPANDDE